MTQTNPVKFDLIIVGAGMIGSSLAVFLGDSNLKVAVIETHLFDTSSQSSFDDRNLVLSQASKNIFESQNLWQTLQTDITPIKQIHISEQNRFGSVLLEAEQLNLNALAYSVKAKTLGKLLHNELAANENLSVFCPATVLEIKQHIKHTEVEIQYNDENLTLQSSLLVLADGSNSKFRQHIGFETNEKDYNQQAIITNVVTELPHQFTAYERFSQHGPLALLPRPAENEFGMVFCVPDNKVSTFLNLSDQEFIDQTTRRFGRRLGKFLRIGTRKAYPLRKLIVDKQYIQRVLLLGNSAHTIHPNAAQGFNLGLRDVAMLVELINNSRNTQQDIGDTVLLERYQQKRIADQQNVIHFTDGLASIFYNNDLLKKSFRGFAMSVVEHLPIVKKSLMLRAMGLYGEQSTMVKQSA